MADPTHSSPPVQLQYITSLRWYRFDLFCTVQHSTDTRPEKKAWIESQVGTDRHTVKFLIEKHVIIIQGSVL